MNAQLIKINHLFTYPVKSTEARCRKVTRVFQTGFENDRRVCVVDRNRNVMTGRAHPTLIKLQSEIDSQTLTITARDGEGYKFRLPRGVKPQTVKLFRNRVLGMPLTDEANEYISDYLNGYFSFVHLGELFRPVLTKRGGLPGEHTGFADSAPVHLINLKTLEYLNSRLANPVSIHRFRPNIVIDGRTPFEEDDWSEIEINGCRFRVQEHTQRCIFTTIDPETTFRDTALQPLATIAAIRGKKGMRPTFGINLVPIKEGTIKVGDIISPK